MYVHVRLYVHRSFQLSTLPTPPTHTHRLEAASCLGLLSSFLPDDELKQLLTSSVLSLDNSSDWAIMQARATALSATLEVATQRMLDMGLKRQVAEAVVALATSDRVPVCVSGLQCLGSFVNKMSDDSPFVVGALKEVCKYRYSMRPSVLNIQTQARGRVNACIIILS